MGLICGVKHAISNDKEKVSLSAQRHIGEEIQYFISNSRFIFNLVASRLLMKFYENLSTYLSTINFK